MELHTPTGPLTHHNADKLNLAIGRGLPRGRNIAPGTLISNARPMARPIPHPFGKISAGT